MHCLSAMWRRSGPIWLAALVVGLFATRVFALPGDAPPQRLVIPAIGVDAGIESVGMNADGAMGSPRNWSNVAWYNLGVAPGRRGNAVLAGHLDNREGNPAVFWDLDELQPGQEILVVDGEGATLKFQVSEVASYRTGQTPMQYVFGPTAATRLNLVTCTGDWNRDVRLYSHRLVVYADLVGTGGPLQAPPPAAAGARNDAAAAGAAEAASDESEAQASTSSEVAEPVVTRVWGLFFRKDREPAVME